jgi:Mg2+ and Co2+ transporter CorA
MINYSYYKFEDNKIIRLNKEYSPEQWLDNIDWVNIYSEDRKQITKTLPFNNLTDDIKNLIIKPEDYLLTKTFNDITIQNFKISKKSEFNEFGYFTLIIAKKITICIFPKGVNYDLENEESEHIKKQFTKNRIYYTYLLIQKILAESTINVSITRKDLYNLEQKMISSPDKVSSSQVMHAFTQIWELSETIEEQYIGFKFFYNVMLNKQKEPDSHKLKEIIDSFSELCRITDRQEDKIESLRMHFMLIHQEESSHKINVLTIIQAIFVPLTFLAGVYGMNFNNMPELTWKYAYFVVWGIFISLAIVLLYFFKKNGWFD